MTNSQPIVIRVAMKPISTLAKPLESVNLQTKQPEAASYERSDVCAVAAASCILENVVAFEIAGRWSRSSAATTWKRSRRAGSCSTRWRGRSSSSRCRLPSTGDRKNRGHGCSGSTIKPGGGSAWRRSAAVHCADGLRRRLVHCLASPRHVRAESRRLGQNLGLDASLDGLRHLRPGVVLYEGLKLSDPETGQPVFRCRSLEVTRTELTDAKGQRRPAFVLAASQPEIEAAAVDRLGQLLQRTLAAQNGRPEIELRWTADRVDRAGRRGFTTLSAVEGAVEFLPGGLQARTEFRLPGDKTAEPVRFRVTRNRQIITPGQRTGVGHRRQRDSLHADGLGRA